MTILKQLQIAIDEYKAEQLAFFKYQSVDPKNILTFDQFKKSHLK